MDVAGGGWWAEALAWAGAPDSLVPELVEAATPLGTGDTETLSQLAGAVLTVAGLDHSAAAVGCGSARLGRRVRLLRHGGGLHPGGGPAG